MNHDNTLNHLTHIFLLLQGLGKTVMLLALIMKCNEERVKRGDDSEEGPTLVVAPLSLLLQWEEEIDTKTNLTYRVHYGDMARSAAGEDFSKDVILTTYGTMQAELKQSRQRGGTFKPNSLLGHSFARVILDEAHCIKNQATLASKACCLIDAKYRWVVTGTVIHNSLDDVFALMKFLKHQPWCEPAFWKSAITTVMHRKENGEPTKEEGDGKGDAEADPTGMMIALERVRRLLAPLMIRRTKASLNKDGTPILTLPPVETKVVNVVLSPAEREFYDSLKLKSQYIFEGFIKAGTASKSWFAIFSLLSRLRMACDHIALTVKAHMDEADWNVATRNEAEAEAEEAKVASASEATNSSNDGVDDNFLNGLLKKFRERSRQTAKSEDGNSEQCDSYSEQVAQTLSAAIKENETHMAEECPICLENPPICSAVITSCAHIFCKDCLVDYLKKNAPAQDPEKSNLFTGMQCPAGHCPSCQSEVDASKIIAISKSEDGEVTTKFLSDGIKQKFKITGVTPNDKPAITKELNARKVLESSLNGADSSKLMAVVQELHNIWKVDPGSKVLIFSQFLGFLDLMETSLRENRIPFGRLDGRLTLHQRMAALEAFKDVSRAKTQASGPGPLSAKQRIGSVMLVSMKAGGVGLNLTAASSVFIVDPWWNDSIESQCINRIHRIGQTAEVVRVRKFVVEDSVEERIVELQQKKKDMASHVYCDDGTNGAMNDSRPSIDDFKLIFGKD